MKRILLLVLLGAAVMFLTSCKENTSQSSNDLSNTKHTGLFSFEKSTSKDFFLSGTYVAIENGRYCKTWDSLTIQKRKNSESLYEIRRKVFYQCYLNDNKMPAVVKYDKWLSSYDEQAGILYIIPQGKKISVNQKGNSLEYLGLSFNRVE